MKRPNCFIMLVCALTTLAACSAAPQSVVEPGPTDNPIAPSPAATVIPFTSTPACEAVTILYEEGAQFELIGPQGSRVMLDVVHPNVLSAPPTENDIQATTHIQHNDHFNRSFSESFPGQQLNGEVGKIELPGVTIQGIASSHSPSGEWSPEKGSNTILIVDMGGIRIVHFGGIGQEALTPEQLDALSQVDIALMQLNNPSSQMSLDNKKAFNLMDQVQPRLIIPTAHNNSKASEYATTKWQGLYTDQASIKLCRSDLPAQTQILFMGQLATSYQALFNLSKASW